jgi:hypothetical protein
MKTYSLKKFSFRMLFFLGTVLLSCVIFIGMSRNKNDSDLIPATDKGQTKHNNESNRLTRISYNNPNLFVDLGVGLWAVPFPVDYTGNGQNDLLVGSGGRPYNGIFHFEGISDEKGPTVFKKAERLSASTARYNMQISHLDDGSWVITEPGTAYPDYRDTFLENGVEIPFSPDFYIGRANQWKYFDYNGNGVNDLIIGASDWREYRWDDAYTEDGKWVNGPLRAFVYWIENLGTNEEPNYGEARKIMAGDTPVEVYGMPSPNFADFTGNGLPDLILGDFLDKFTFFENVGIRTVPKYAQGRHLKYQGDVIKMDLQMIQPSAIDWDGDGNIDLIVGDEDGRVAFMKNTGRIVDGVPEFEPPVYFQQQADEVKIGALATPFAYDWNGNGLQDLIVGNTAGYLMLVENLGGYPPKWDAPQYLEADGEVIRILAGENGSIQGPAEAKWGYTVLSVADWNGNGLPDIIVNSIWGKVLWYENIGTRTEPRLAAAQPIEVEWEGETPKPVWNWWNPEGKDLVTQWRSTVQVIDLNENGLMDLVALDQEGFLAFYERREVNGELTLMPPQRIFFAEEGAPTTYASNHGSEIYEGKDGVNLLAGYNDDGSLSYVARSRRPAPPRVVSSIYQIPGLFQDIDQTASEINGEPLRLNVGWAGMSGRRKFHLADWTGNGRLDLIVNSGVNANLMENISTEPREFIFRDRGQMDEVPIGGHTSNPVTVDWDQNGIPDLLIGGEDGFLYYMKNPRSKN